MQLNSLNFLIDTQLPPVLAAFLTRKGFATIHTSRVKEGGEFMSDSEIISYAIDNDFIIVTKDKDFTDYFFAKGAPPKILQLQLGNIKNNELIDTLELNIQLIAEMFSKGDNLIIFNQNSLVSY